MNKEKEVPEEFQARTLDGKEITGEDREKLYRYFDATIDTFLEKLAKEEQ